MIANLLLAFDRAVNAGAPPGELALHLDCLGAIVDSHVGYEERQLLGVLTTLELDTDVHAVLGPL